MPTDPNSIPDPAKIPDFAVIAAMAYADPETEPDYVATLIAAALDALFPNNLSELFVDGYYDETGEWKTDAP